MDLQVIDIVKTYNKGKIRIPALNGISFESAGGSFTGIIGRSGSGKSTLLNLVGGLDRASSGHILFRGTDLSSMNRRELAMHRRHTVGMVFQSFNLINSGSALDNVMLPLIFAGMSRKKRRERARDLLARVGLEERRDHLPGELSGGEAQRVAIARALANDPPMLLADEPTGNLDSITAGEIITLLQDLNKKSGITVLMVTHDKETAESVSDRIIRLRDGKMAEEI